MPHHYLSRGDREILDSLFEKLNIQVRDLDNRSRDRVLLNLSARLCELVAFDNAGVWSPSSVADLVQISARLERKTMPLGDME